MVPEGSPGDCYQSSCLSLAGLQKLPREDRESHSSPRQPSVQRQRRGREQGAPAPNSAGGAQVRLGCMEQVGLERPAGDKVGRALPATL